MDTNPGRWHCWHPRAEDLKNSLSQLPDGKDQMVENELQSPPAPLWIGLGIIRGLFTVTAE